MVARIWSGSRGGKKVRDCGGRASHDTFLFQYILICSTRIRPCPRRACHSAASSRVPRGSTTLRSRRQVSPQCYVRTLGSTRGRRVVPPALHTPSVGSMALPDCRDTLRLAYIYNHPHAARHAPPPSRVDVHTRPSTSLRSSPRRARTAGPRVTTSRARRV